MLKTILAISILATMPTFVGCGTTGPLYIPEQRYPLPEDDAPKAPTAASDNQSITE